MAFAQEHPMAFLAARAAAIPDHAALDQFRCDHAVDCFASDAPCTVTLPHFVEAFLTSRMFRPERFLLAVLLGKPSRDRQAMAFINGDVDRFAAWTADTDLPDLFIMRDFMGLTRAWFMCAPQDNGATLLYWGTISVSSEANQRRHRIWPRLFGVIMPFHRLYSRMLLSSAAKQLAR